MKIVEKKEFPNLANLYLAEFRDDPRLMAEFVDTLEPGVPKDQKWVMMVSTQFGCPVGCFMCDAGSLGFSGNLSAEEIMSQIRAIIEDNPSLDIRTHPKVKIHLARMGEPTLNPRVLEALKIIAKELPYPGIIPSVSTVAPRSPVVSTFLNELIAIKDDFFGGGRFQMQFSIHTTDEGKRRALLPVKQMSLEEIASYGARFVKKGDRKVTLNFARSREAEFDTDKIKGSFSPEKFLIKITPINPTSTADKNQATYLWQKLPEEIEASIKELGHSGFGVVLSPSSRQEIAAETSCGQLWSAILKKRVDVLNKNKTRDLESYVTMDNLAQKLSLWEDRVKPYQRGNFSLNPSRAALLIVDTQEFFLNPSSPAYLAPGRAILANVRRLRDAFRAADRPVFFTYHAHENPQEDGGLMTLWWKHVCLEGSPWVKVLPFLEPDEDRTFRKCRYSAFSHPALEESLRQEGIEELVIVGVMTNLCVESTVRDAFDLGFKSFVPLDATAAFNEELHLASLKNLACGFAQVLSTSQVLSQLKCELAPF